MVTRHELSFNNRKLLTNNKKCGCFYCLRVFNSGEIKDWTDNGTTAICPYCGVDSIIGEKSTEDSTLFISEFILAKMRKYYFYDNSEYADIELDKKLEQDKDVKDHVQQSILEAQQGKGILCNSPEEIDDYFDSIKNDKSKLINRTLKKDIDMLRKLK